MSNITVFDTDLQNKIAQLLFDGIEPMRVAEICQCTNPAVYDVKMSHKFALFCYNSAMQELMTIGAKAAVDCLIEVVKDPKAGKATRVSAADKLLHYTGLRVTAEGTVEKSPATMTQAEIQARLQALQAEAANRAKNVTIEGNGTVIDTESAPVDISNLL